MRIKQNKRIRKGLKLGKLKGKIRESRLRMVGSHEKNKLEENEFVSNNYIKKYYVVLLLSQAIFPIALKI